MDLPPKNDDASGSSRADGDADDSKKPVKRRGRTAKPKATKSASRISGESPAPSESTREAAPEPQRERERPDVQAAEPQERPSRPEPSEPSEPQAQAQPRED